MTAIAIADEATTKTSRNAILALSLGAFAIGASEFMISGLLAEVAADLEVTIPLAGLLITGYALGVTVGGPLTSILTGRMNRKNQLLLLVALFVCGNLLCAVAPSYELLLAGRIMGAFCHGAFYGTASVVAGMLVPSGHRARAIALISAGTMIANILGVPGGTALGNWIDWRAAFWAVSLFGATAALAISTFVPDRQQAGSVKLSTEFRALVRPQVVMGLVLCVCFTIGLFTFFSYLTPLLVDVSGADPDVIPLMLVLFGVGSTFGVLLGGKLADWQIATSIAIALAAQASVYFAFWVFSANLTATVTLIPLVGFAAMIAVAPLKTLVIRTASDAPGLASTMTSSANNLGVAAGAALGALLISNGVGLAYLPLIGVAFPLLGLGVLFVVQRLRDAW
jgi:DHA1 family inner membrane transport protein